MANEQHIQWLLEGVEAWNERREEGGELADVDPDFSGANIRDLFADTFDIPHMEPTPLSEYNLVGANFTNANLWNTDFTGAELVAADLIGADLIRANFSGSDLEETDFTNAKLWIANLTGAKFLGANLTNAELDEAELDGANFIGANLSGVSLNSTQLSRAILYHINESPEQYHGMPESVTSIGELLTAVRQLSSYYEYSDWDTTLYFRGEYCTGWGLRPSVMRDEGLIASEGKMLLDLISQRPEEFGGQDLAMDQWVLTFGASLRNG